MHPQYTAIHRNVTRHSTLDSTFRWLSLATRFWTDISPPRARYPWTLAFHVIPRRQGPFVHPPLPLIAGARWRILRNVNVRIIWETRGILEDDSRAGRTSSTHSSRVSLLFRCLPSAPRCAPMPTISSLPAFLVLLFRHPLLLHYPSDERRRLRVLSSRLSPIISPSLPPSSSLNPSILVFLIRHLVAISCFSLPSSLIGSRGRQSEV